MPCVARRPEDERLAMLEDEGRLRARLAIFELGPDAVVEDRAVLEDLDERRALVLVGPPQDLLHVLRVDVDGAGHEGGAAAEREGDRVDG